jgi:phosphoribosylformimino-5-aminoimidazole carboxamide ribotide isomerase
MALQIRFKTAKYQLGELRIFMILYPAIDLKDGKAVRLLRGDMNKSTVFNDSPVDQALSFVNQGCQWLHLVDLNGAFEGKPVNADAVEQIISRCNIPIQLGGGIRDIETIEMWLSRGLERIILGTAAAENPSLVRLAANKYPGKIAVGIDARDGRVATDGWAKDTDIWATELARKFENDGVSTIIYTDIERDGAMMGPNLGATAEMAKAVSIPIIASGGISSLKDLIALQECGAQLNGAISGRALYDQKFSVAQALEVLDA